MGWGWSPRSDLLRVDILNTIGLSLALAALVPLAARGLWQRVALAAGIAAGISLVTPPLWTTWKPPPCPGGWPATSTGDISSASRAAGSSRFFHGPAFLFAGVAAVLIVMRARRANQEGRVIVSLAAWASPPFSFPLDRSPAGTFYAVYNYWTTSLTFSWPAWDYCW